jgi:hypothetical protein
LYPLIVDGKGRVKVKTNWYSTPLWPGNRLTARVWPLSVEISCDGELAAQHTRCYGRGHQILDLEHYLDVLEKKPGAMAGSTPLQQWREAGKWPACLDRIWRELEQRHGRSVGTRDELKPETRVAGPREGIVGRRETRCRKRYRTSGLVQRQANAFQWDIVPPRCPKCVFSSTTPANSAVVSGTVEGNTTPVAY